MPGPRCFRKVTRPPSPASTRRVSVPATAPAPCAPSARHFMNASSQLRSLYEQWRLLTEQEGTAIRAADWTRVGECQSEKKRLQPHIQKADDELQDELRT